MKCSTVAMILLIYIFSGEPADADSSITIELIDLSELSATVNISAPEAVFEVGVVAEGAVRLERLYLRHPMLALGNLAPGPLMRLINSSAGAWTVAPVASLIQPSEMPDFGLLISPFPKRFSFVVFRESDLLITALHLSGSFLGAHPWEILSVLTQEEGEAKEGGWLFERPPALSSVYAHTLARLTLNTNTGFLLIGGVVSSSRFGMPGLRVSSSCELDIGSAVVSAEILCATLGYRTISGKTANAPLLLSWEISTEGPGTFRTIFRHKLEIEYLPLIYIPYRRSDEKIELQVTAGGGTFEAAGKVALRLRGDRFGGLLPEIRGEIELGYSGSVLSGGIVATVDAVESDSSFFRISLPWAVETMHISARGRLTLEYQEDPAVGATFELTGRLDEKSRLFFRVKTATPLTLSMETFHNLSDSPLEYVEVELGWTAKEEL